MENFTYYAPTKVVFGRGVETQAGSLAKAAGAHTVLVHYGSDRIQKSGLLDRVVTALKAADLKVVTLGGVVPNPELGLIRQGIALAREQQVDFILAIGGGSVIDSAKAIALGALDDGDVWELYRHERRVDRALPGGSVLTIAAAGSEMSGGSVVTNEVTHEKCDYGGDVIRPKFALLNPELTTSLPWYQTAAGCTDILMHTMERYFTPSSMATTDGIAEALMRTVIEQTKTLKADPTNYEARAEVMWAGSLSHNDLTGVGDLNGGDWSTHMLEHEVSGMFGVTHGAGLAAIWGSWARLVYQNCLPRFVRFAREVWGIEGTDDEAVALAGIEAMEAFYREIGMPTSLGELGVHPTPAQIDQMVTQCLRATGGQSGTARVLKRPEMTKIYEMANH